MILQVNKMIKGINSCVVDSRVSRLSSVGDSTSPTNPINYMTSPLKFVGDMEVNTNPNRENHRLVGKLTKETKEFKYNKSTIHFNDIHVFTNSRVKDSTSPKNSLSATVGEAESQTKPIRETLETTKELKVFTSSSTEPLLKTIKSKNDENNKLRENIIGAIINDKVPLSFYETLSSPLSSSEFSVEASSSTPPLLKINRWLSIKNAINNYIDILLNSSVFDSRVSRIGSVFDSTSPKNNTPYKKISCIHKAGRIFNHDFIFIVDYYDEPMLLEDGVTNRETLSTPSSFPEFRVSASSPTPPLLQTLESKTKEFNIEFKFNASTIDETPQYVSPMRTSQYIINQASYEEYWYDNYLPLLLLTYNIKIPEKEIYMKQIHSNKPKCMLEIQKKYYQGCSTSSQYLNNEEDIKFYKFANTLSKESISTFIQLYDLDVDSLSKYLQKTQEKKIYMLYHNDEFKIQYVNMDDYIIESVVKNPNLNRYECMTKSGKKMKVLLRWKNGNGIAFPAFQIS